MAVPMESLAFIWRVFSVQRFCSFHLVQLSTFSFQPFTKWTFSFFPTNNLNRHIGGLLARHSRHIQPLHHLHIHIPYPTKRPLPVFPLNTSQQKHPLIHHVHFRLIIRQQHHLQPCSIPTCSRTISRHSSRYARTRTL